MIIEMYHKILYHDMLKTYIINGVQMDDQRMQLHVLS